jgi:hypothetical protein
LDHNNIVEVDTSAFASLTGLHILYIIRFELFTSHEGRSLGGNSLRNVSDGLFHSNAQLQYLFDLSIFTIDFLSFFPRSLADNHLSSLPVSLFLNSPAIRTL